MTKVSFQVDKNVRQRYDKVPGELGDAKLSSQLDVQCLPVAQQFTCHSRAIPTTARWWTDMKDYLDLRALKSIVLAVWRDNKPTQSIPTMERLAVHAVRRRNLLEQVPPSQSRSPGFPTPHAPDYGRIPNDDALGTQCPAAETGEMRAHQIDRDGFRRVVHGTRWFLSEPCPLVRIKPVGLVSRKTIPSVVARSH
ncbi:hypothetical protein OG21DRAFT_1521352 [Imleria badia]|nr:hypothetical protein OG21DRAFT_1521352 [Imleria badia]